jgi:5-methylcytosine-specific restriction endonuclease McrA
VTSLPAKTCSKCKELKTLIEFSKSAQVSDGHHRYCKLCDTARVRAWQAANPPHILAARKQLAAERALLGIKACSKCGEDKTLEEFPTASKEKDGHGSRCKGCIQVSAKIYRDNTKDKAASYYQRSKLADPEKFLKRNREYRAANVEKIREAGVRYNLENQEKQKERARIYRENNPDLGRANVRKRRARRAGNGVEVYTELQVLETYGTDCHICSGPVDLNNARRVGHPGWETGLHIDHVIPISKGGQDSLANVRPSHGGCNLKKNARLKGEF